MSLYRSWLTRFVISMGILTHPRTSRTWESVSIFATLPWVCGRFLLLETRTDDNVTDSESGVETTKVGTLPSRSASTKEVVSVIVRGTVGPSPMMSRILKLQDENSALRKSLADELANDSGSVSSSYHHRYTLVYIDC